MIKFKWKNKTIKSTQKTDNILLLIIGGLVATVTPKLVNWFLLLQDNIKNLPLRAPRRSRLRPRYLSPPGRRW
ncbi:hypothetical protein ACR2U3_26145, partial [Klebsiella pneumoniae]